MTTTTNPYSEEALGKSLGRNEPCPCGSGKKYKRCHGVDAAPKLSVRATPTLPAVGEGGAAGDANAAAGAGASPFAGFDPSKMDPQMMAQMSQVLQQIPRGQLQKLQSIMQKAMSGKDVRAEAAEFEKSLPPRIQESLKTLSMGMLGSQMGGMPSGSTDLPANLDDLSVDDAKAIVERAMSEGKLSSDQAQELLKVEASAEKKEEKASLWKRLTGKK